MELCILDKQKIICFILCRCLLTKASNSTIPQFCAGFYLNSFDNAYYNGGTLPGIEEALNYTLETVSNSNNDQCAELIGHYLCHYYYPVCDIDHNEILPVCSSSCNLLFNNEECSDLYTNALNLIAEHNVSLVPSNDSCTMTYRSFADSVQPDASEDSCLDIEGQNLGRLTFIKL